MSLIHRNHFSSRLFSTQHLYAEIHTHVTNIKPHITNIHAASKTGPFRTASPLHKASQVSTYTPPHGHRHRGTLYSSPPLPTFLLPLAPILPRRLLLVFVFLIDALLHPPLWDALRNLAHYFLYPQSRYLSASFNRAMLHALLLGDLKNVCFSLRNVAMDDTIGGSWGVTCLRVY